MTENKAHRIHYNDHKMTKNTFEAAFESYYRPLCFFAEKITDIPTVSEDIVGDTFIKLWNKQPAINQPEELKPLLYSSVKNACIDYLRTKKRKSRLEDELKTLHYPDISNFTLIQMVKTEVMAEIYSELQKLPPECRKVMELIYVEGWSIDQIAEYFNLSTSTIKTQKARGLQALRRRFGASILISMFFRV